MGSSKKMILRSEKRVGDKGEKLGQSSVDLGKAKDNQIGTNF